MSPRNYQVSIQVSCDKILYILIVFTNLLHLNQFDLNKWMHQFVVYASQQYAG